MGIRSVKCCILGAGPAGLGVALELVRHGVNDVVIVDRNSTVGGLARTESFDGSRFDVGPHRFFTKNTEINSIWHDTLGADFRPIQRLTRIYYKDKFFNYPIKAFDTIAKLGINESLHAVLSFISSKLTPNGERENYEDWMVKKFGRKLYETFFKTYTEKVWGIPCHEISAEWAAQRIKGLDIIQVLKSALLIRSNTPKTLVEEFDYPVYGAGQMYEAMADKIEKQGVDILLDSSVTSIQHLHNRIQSISVRSSISDTYLLEAQQYFSSIPITHFFKMLTPIENEEVIQAAIDLYYRDHITVNLLVDGDNLFPDQWIYVHSPEVQMARLTNYNNFSKQMVGRIGKSALSVEYFVFQHESLWQMSDEDLKALACEDLERLNLVKKERVDQAWVVRETESYPTYYLGFKEPYHILKKRMNQFDNLYPIGRGGLYKYNNQDHSLYSGILAARNFLKLPGSPFNLWNINIDAEYHEGGERSQ